MKTSARYLLAASLLISPFIFAYSYGNSEQNIGPINQTEAIRVYDTIEAIYEGKPFPLEARAVTWEETPTIGLKRLRMQLVSTEKSIALKRYTIEIFDKHDRLLVRSNCKHRGYIYTLLNSSGYCENVTSNDHKPSTKLLVDTPIDFLFQYPSNIAFHNAPYERVFPRMPQYRIKLTINEFEEIK